MVIKNNPKPEAKASCCVCNRTYSDGEIGWTYCSFYKVYTCSTECYKSDEYKMFCIEEKKLYSQNSVVVWKEGDPPLREGWDAEKTLD